MLKHKQWRIYAILFIFALAARLLYLTCSYGLGRLSDHPDGAEYHAYAVNLAEHGTYTDGQWTAFRAPGYPAFMSVVIRFWGDSYAKIQIAQTIVSSFIPLLVYGIGLSVGGPTVALISGVVACVHFGLVDEPAHMMSESVFTILYALVLLFTLKAAKSTKYSIACGVVLALAWLTRPVGVLLLPFSCAWLLIKCGIRIGAKRIALVLSLTLIVMMPWWIRNYRLHHAFIPSALQTGFVLLSANVPPAALSSVMYVHDSMPELQRDQALMKDGIAYFKAQPISHLLKRAVTKMLIHFYPFLPVYDLFYMLLLPFCFVGIIVSLKKVTVD